MTLIDPAVLPLLDPEEETQSLLTDLGTQLGGLDEREAARRLQVGLNAIRRDSGPRAWRSLLAQFTHPLALLLWLAAALSLVTGVLTLSVAIVVVIVLNAGLPSPMACFAPIVWGSDELRRAWMRRQPADTAGTTSTGRLA